MSSNATEILSGLWIGDKMSVKDESFLMNKQIEVIINCSNDKKTPDYPIIKMKYYINLNSTMRFSEMCQMLDKYCDLIKVCINSKNILIYCDTGNTHSPLLIVMFLMKHVRLDPATIQKLLQTKRQNISSCFASHGQLLHFYQNIRGI